MENLAARLSEQTLAREKSLKELNDRVSKLEKGGVSSGAVDVDSTLAELKQIRKNLTVLDTDSALMQEENKLLAAENIELRTLLAKRDYRIEHLLRALEEEEKRSWVMGVMLQYSTCLDVVSLKQSCQELLRQLPWLGGQVEGKKIVHNDSGIDFAVQARDELMSSLPFDLADDGLLMPELVQSAEKMMNGEASLMGIKVTQFRDGSVLGVCANHGMMDGLALLDVIAHWARLTKLMQDGHADLHPLKSFSADRQLLPETCCDKDAVVNFFTQQEWTPLGKDVIAALWGERVQMHRLVEHFSLQELRAIKATATEHSESVFLTTFESTISHICRVLSEAVSEVCENETDPTPSQIVSVISSRNALRFGRKLLDTNSSFCGNCLMSDCLKLEVQPHQHSLSSLADQLHTRLSKARDPDYTREFMGLMHGMTTCQSPFSVFDPSKRCFFTNSCAAHPILQQSDFGSGNASRLCPQAHGDTVFVFPTMDGGADAYITPRWLKLSPSQEERLMELLATEAYRAKFHPTSVAK